MKYQSVHVGFWQPQSTIHLKEFYDALGFYRSQFFDAVEIRNWVKPLKPRDVEYLTNEINSVEGFFLDQFRFDVLEDGLVITSDDAPKTLKTSYKQLNKFLQKDFATFWQNIYQLDIPEQTDEKKNSLSTLENPVVFVIKNAKIKEIEGIFAEFDDTVHKRINLQKGQVWIGERMVVLHNVTLKKDARKEAIRYLMFARLYELKLQKLLTTQRIILKKIQYIQRKKYYKNVELPAVRDDALDLLTKTLTSKSDLETLAQFLRWRGKYVEEHLSDHVLSDTFKGFFASLQTTQSFLTEQWNVTHQYANSALQSISLLYSDNERSELRVLQRLFLVSTVISIISLGTFSGSMMTTVQNDGAVISRAKIVAWNMQSLLFFGMLSLILFMVIIALFSIGFTKYKSKKIEKIREQERKNYGK